MPRPVDSGGPSHPRPRGCSRVAFGVREHPRRPQQAYFEAVPALQGTRLPLRPTGFSVYASSILFAVLTATTPPWTQDSIRVGGSPDSIEWSRCVDTAPEDAWRENHLVVRHVPSFRRSSAKRPDNAQAAAMLKHTTSTQVTIPGLTHRTGTRAEAVSKHTGRTQTAKTKDRRPGQRPTLPNKGVQPTGNSVRSCVAPALPSG